MGPAPFSKVGLTSQLNPLYERAGPLSIYMSTKGREVRLEPLVLLVPVGPTLPGSCVRWVRLETPCPSNRAAIVTVSIPWAPLGSKRPDAEMTPFSRHLRMTRL